MVFENSGVNIDGISNLEPINLTINTTDLLVTVPQKANEVTGGLFGIIVSIPMFIYLFITLSDISEFGSFRFSKVRALGIGSGITGVLGLVALSIGFFNNFAHIVVFLTLMIVSIIWVYLEEN